jgi:hypothetical protein
MVIINEKWMRNRGPKININDHQNKTAQISCNTSLKPGLHFAPRNADACCMDDVEGRMERASNHCKVLSDRSRLRYAQAMVWLNNL